MDVTSLKTKKPMFTNKLRMLSSLNEADIN